MRYARINTKRQLLADLFTGKAETLWAYKGKQEQKQRSSRRAADATTRAVKYRVNLEDSHTLLIDEE
ncbi:hypothetical protein GCM10028803_34230 [Larkinella knui]|uniref:Uncharacterized protein n=1 Tax=Larkinella knui TaxID=2025310 RepID=A0A3P1CDK8_9BACT|nr:hypothetical protein [Larkinella knui]RRB11300.1 hypothetical protein EHT87_22685 [Larkinella knui]